MAIFMLPPDVAKRDFGGHPGFQSRTSQSGTGIARYSQARGFQGGYDTPTKVGARYFPPQPEFNDVTDQPLPIATGNKWDGGGEAYRERVYNAAKKDRKKLGFTRSDISDLKPRKVA